MRPMRPTPITPMRSVPVVVVVAAAMRSPLPQGDDVLPGPRLRGAQQRGLDADPLHRLGEAGLVGAALDDRRAELVVLDDDQVLEADAVGAAGDEVPVVGEAVAA